MSQSTTSLPEPSFQAATADFQSYVGDSEVLSGRDNKNIAGADAVNIAGADAVVADENASTCVGRNLTHTSRLASLSNPSLSSAVANELTLFMPASGKWYKALSVPENAVALYIRFAHKSDVKLPGAERRSSYYKVYGNPNYGGIQGVLSRSFRRRARHQRLQLGTLLSNGDLRRVLMPPSTSTESG
ncbi:unnamed protein product [Protopolystoma xenopodis]|uniref:Nuclear cap-binding protein subunit 3 n=1 Tax=Protopolystoma xenopodis TaxID=117903 RepID=A0A448XNW1_9PLAT|nr:unnamed protein product [Protopolystoma xenopodis]